MKLNKQDQILLSSSEQTIVKECERMVDLTGEVKATDMEYNYILDGMEVKDKKTLKEMSKDIINKPIFKNLHDWILSPEEDYMLNRLWIVKMAEGYLKRYKDIFAVTEEQLYPPVKVSIKDEPSVAKRIANKIKNFGRKKFKHGKHKRHKHM
jgi:hypothetical protein